jgi:succinoglycan biosynthesis transport protein ExoP
MHSEHPEHPEQRPTRTPVTTSKAVRHHLPVVLVCLLLGAWGGFLYASGSPTTYTSTARVLVNPSVGNPFVPTPASVRQDELTSLETEAQVVQSDEVLDVVAKQVPQVSVRTLERQVQVFVPANTQVLEISFTGGDPVVSQKVADGVAQAYLDNRANRFEQLNDERIQRVETRTTSVVDDLRTATSAAQHGGDGERLFQSELSDALRNELVSLRAQRTALENSASPPGSVIAPAQAGKSVRNLKAAAAPIGGALLGLAVGCLIAVLLERWRGVVRSATEVEAVGVPVVASVPARSWLDRLRRRGAAEAIDTTIRRVRATILDLDPRPDVVTVAPAGRGRSDAEVGEAVAESFAKAGHRVVLVRTDAPLKKGLGVDDKGLAQAMLYERLNVLDLLQPSVEPLLSLLTDGGFTPQSRELLVADRVRAVLLPLVQAGHLVVIQSPGLDTPEGEAFLGAADLSLVVITTGRTRPRALEQVAKRRQLKDPALGTIVVGKEGATRRTRLPLEDADSHSKKSSAADSQVTRARQ